MLKTCLCLIGTGRSIQHTHANLRENLIEPFGKECDVFIHTIDSPFLSDIRDIFEADHQVKLITSEKEPEYDLSGYRFKSNWPPAGQSTKQVYIKMINSRKNMGEVLLKYEKENNTTYDRVIFSRMDVKYFKKVAIQVGGIDLDKLHVPDFHNIFGGSIDGYNDRFAIGNRENMGIYFRVPDSIDDFLSDGGSIHAETLLKWHLASNDISTEKVPVRFTRTRADGTDIDLRLAKGDLERRDT